MADATDGDTKSRRTSGSDFIVRLRPLSHRHTRVTLGMLLKVLGRRYDLQCRDVMEVPRDQDVERVRTTDDGKEDRH